MDPCENNLTHTKTDKTMRVGKKNIINELDIKTNSIFLNINNEVFKGRKMKNEVFQQ